MRLAGCQALLQTRWRVGVDNDGALPRGRRHCRSLLGKEVPRVQVKREEPLTQSPGLLFGHCIEGALSQALGAPLLRRNPGERLVYARVLVAHRAFGGLL